MTTQSVWASAFVAEKDLANARAGAKTPHPPFLETKNQLRPLPKMRRIFHSGEGVA